MAKIIQPTNRISSLNENFFILDKITHDVISFDKSNIKFNLVDPAVEPVIKTIKSGVQKDLLESKTSSTVFIDEESAFDKFQRDLINMLKNEEFETGFSNPSEDFVRNYLERNSANTMNWLGTILHDYFNDIKIAIGILHIISHFDYKDVKPYGPFLALSGTRHENAEVKDFAIKAFENWGSRDSLVLLETIHCPETWLQKYVEAIIRKLKEE